MNRVLLAEALAKLAASDTHIEAIVPVDLLGKMTDYPAIIELANQYGVPVFSDAAESLDASLDGSPNDSFGEGAILPFNGNKAMTTSGGGMYPNGNGYRSSYADSSRLPGSGVGQNRCSRPAKLLTETMPEGSANCSCSAPGLFTRMTRHPRPSGP